MSVAKIGGYPIPYVYAIVIDREILGDEARTAAESAAHCSRRTWRLQTRPVNQERS